MIIDFLTTPKTLDEWHEDRGPVLWWSWDKEAGQWLGEPPYVGTPLDLGFEVLVSTLIQTAREVPEPIGPDDGSLRVNLGGWPGYHTHWTPLPPMPKAPQ